MGVSQNRVPLFPVLVGWNVFLTIPRLWRTKWPLILERPHLTHPLDSYQKSRRCSSPIGKLRLVTALYSYLVGSLDFRFLGSGRLAGHGKHAIGWLLGCLVARLLGCLVAWLLGCLVARLLGCLVARLLGCLVAWLLGCLVASLLVCLVASLLLCLVWYRFVRYSLHHVYCTNDKLTLVYMERIRP